MSQSPSRQKFWLQFQVQSDGLGPAQPSDGGSFRLFPNLPPELRLQVWKCLLAPRIIAVSCIDGSNATEQLADLASRPAYPLVPVLLHINREARALALSHYTLTFAWKVPHALASADLPPSPWLAAASYVPPTWTEPRVYFSFAADALLLLGELEPYDAAGGGFGSPMAYFLRREDARRVRRVALAFRALRYGETGPQQIFGALFHVVDRFCPPDGRVLVCVGEGDEVTHALLGGEGPLVPRQPRDGDGAAADDEGVAGLLGELAARYREVAMGDDNAWAEGDAVEGPEENVIQGIWRNWYRGNRVTGSLANVEFKLIWETELESYLV